MVTDKSNSAPKVSIVMPTYNRRDMIKEAIESVQAQSFKDWELIIVDDGSDDGTCDFIRTQFGDDGRIVLMQQNHGGAVSARRLGIREAKGEYLAFLDDDDAIYPGKLSKQISFLDTHPDIGLVYSFVDIVDQQRNHISVQPERPVVNFQGLVAACTIQPNALLVRSFLFRNTTDMAASLRGCDDYLYSLRASLSMPIAFLHERVGFYRQHEYRMSSDRLARMKNNIAVCSLILKEKLSRGNRKACMKRLAEEYYELASHLVDDKIWFESACNFVSAVRHNPAVGLQVRWSRFQLPLYRLLKPYAAVALAIIRSIVSKLKEQNVVERGA